MPLSERLVRWLAALLLACAAISAQPALAHGEEPHSEKEERQQASEDREGSDAAEADVEGAEPAADMPDRSLGMLLSNLHPATVHFAIALFLVAGLTELVGLARPSPGLDAAVRVMVLAGAIGAVVAALFGWIHTGLWFGGQQVMQTHRWLGTGIAVVGVIAAWLYRDTDRYRTIARLILFALAIAVLVQGWLGGELAHGAGHLFR